MKSDKEIVEEVMKKFDSRHPLDILEISNKHLRDNLNEAISLTKKPYEEKMLEMKKHFSTTRSLVVKELEEEVDRFKCAVKQHIKVERNLGANINKLKSKIKELEEHIQFIQNVAKDSKKRLNQLTDKAKEVQKHE